MERGCLGIQRGFAALCLTALVLTPSAGFSAPWNLSYQGSVLQSNGTPVADGDYDIRVSLYDHPWQGTVQWTETTTEVVVTNGLFSCILGSITPIPVTLFPLSASLWLQVAVDLNSNGSFEAEEMYWPRQALTGVPWAMNAQRLDGWGVDDFAAYGHNHAEYSLLTHVHDALYSPIAHNHDALYPPIAHNHDALYPPIAHNHDSLYWSTTGNAGITSGTHYLGTSDASPLHLGVDGAAVLRIEPTAEGTPNIIAGYSGNSVGEGVVGATISGGGVPGFRNQVNEDGGTIAGGAANFVSGVTAFVAGGFGNSAEGTSSFAGGYRARAAHEGSFVWADRTIALGPFESTKSNQFAVRANGGMYLSEDANSAAVEVGERYRDNATIAWARVNSNGTISTEFGIDAVSRDGVGDYEITLTATTWPAGGTALIPMAVAEIDVRPLGAANLRVVSVNQTGASTFKVYMNDGLGGAADNDFVFMVTGR